MQGEVFGREPYPAPGRPYTPRPLADARFSFRNETMAAMADAELSFARIDERCVRYPYGSSLRKALARLEAISTICVDGVAPDLRAVLAFGAIGGSAAEDRADPAGRLATINDAGVRTATVDTVRYERLINRIFVHPRDTLLTERNLLRAHAYLRYGIDDALLVHYRRQPYHVTVAPGKPDDTIYVPPQPDRLGTLMRDLFAFATSVSLSPVTQAAVSHFQLEAIRPFKTAMDRTGRAFAHAIQRRRGFSDHLVPPIALVPAMNIERHARLLFPYRTGRPFTVENAAVLLDEWVLHCAKCIALSTNLVGVYMSGIAGIVEGWKERVGEYRDGSALDILLRELPGTPMVSVASAMELTGKGFSAANEAIGQLTERGILRPVAAVRRNRHFEAVEVVEMERSILDKAIPADVKARESFCVQ